MTRSPNSSVPFEEPDAAADAAAAQDRAHPGGQLGGGEGLHHIVVGAQLEAQDPVGLQALGRDQDHRHVAGAADGGQDVEAVLGGEHDVEDDQVGLAVAQAADGLGPGHGLGDLVALHLEQAAEHAPDLGVVVDHEELAHRPARHRLSSAQIPPIPFSSPSSCLPPPLRPPALPLRVVAPPFLCEGWSTYFRNPISRLSGRLPGPSWEGVDPL